MNIQMRLKISEDMREEALSLLGRAVASNVVCESGHLASGNVLGNVLAVLVDPGWDSVDEKTE